MFIIYQINQKIMKILNIEKKNFELFSIFRRPYPLEVSVVLREAECFRAGDQDNQQGGRWLSVLGGGQGWNEGQFSEMISRSGGRCYSWTTKKLKCINCNINYYHFLVFIIYFHMITGRRLFRSDAIFNVCLLYTSRCV